VQVPVQSPQALVIETFPEPSNDTEPVTFPVSDIVLAVDNLSEDKTSNAVPSMPSTKSASRPEPAPSLPECHAVPTSIFVPVFSVAIYLLFK
jgi:hypothetical protein